MSDVVLKQLPLLQLLATASPITRKKILKAANYELTRAIVECVCNVIVGNIGVTQKRYNKLRKHKNILRMIHSKTNNEWLHKKRLIVQSGGSFLPLLLTPVITYLFSKISSG